MAILAGIVALHPHAPIPFELKEQLRGLLVRRGAEPIPENGVTTAHESEGAYLVKFDTNAFQEPGVERAESGAVAMIAGEARLQAAGERRARRAEDLRRIREGWERGDHAVLGRARGAFCAAVYAPATRSLLLATDRLGLRPLYVGRDGELLYFASAARILEGLGRLKKTVDIKGLAEALAFGFSLGDRTSYAGISRLYAGECLKVESFRVQRERYWRWDELEVRQESEEAGIEAAHEQFMDSVRSAAGEDSSTPAFLSGGMDSRAIVCGLRQLGLTVHSINVSREESLDRQIADRFSRQVGTIHHNIQYSWAPDDYIPLVVSRIWKPQPGALDTPPERGRMIWSGDGGSVSVGAVYITPEVLAASRGGDRAEMMRLIGARHALPLRLFRETWGVRFAAALQEGLAEEFESIRGEDLLRRYHLFLMLNDQRQHLSRFYEDCDQHRLELHLPFFDSEFLKVILSLPTERLLFHRFYAAWIERFPAFQSTAWQTYPGHAGCPLPLPEGANRQHSPEVQRVLSRRLGDAIAGKVRALVTGSGFPPVLKRSRIAAGLALHAMGVGDFTYMFRTVLNCWQPFTVAEGRCGSAPAGESLAPRG